MRQNLDSGLSDSEVLLLDDIHWLKAYFVCQIPVKIWKRERQSNPCSQEFSPLEEVDENIDDDATVH